MHIKKIKMGASVIHVKVRRRTSFIRNPYRFASRVSERWGDQEDLARRKVSLLKLILKKCTHMR
jgi:hypothetical protein